MAQARSQDQHQRLLRSLAVSITGNIQPDKFLGLPKAEQDQLGGGDGLWSRFLFCAPPRLPFKGDSISTSAPTLLRCWKTTWMATSEPFWN